MKKTPMFMMMADAPAGASPAPAAAPAAPAPAAPAAAPAVHQAPPPAPPKFEKVDVIKEMGLAGVKGPKEAIGAEGARAKTDKTAATLVGKGENKGFKPEAPARRAAKAPPTPPKATPDIVPPEAPAGTLPPVPPVAPPAPPISPAPPAPPVATVKLGDKEYTPAELQAIIKEREDALAAGKTPPPATPPVAPTAPPAAPQTAEEKTAAILAMDQKFIDDTAKSINLEQFGIGIKSEEDMDIILSGGAEGIAKYNADLQRAIAVGQLNAQKTFADQANPLFAELRPVLEHYREIQRYVKDNQFLDRYPEVKAHPKGLEESRTVRTALKAKYDRIQQLIAVNVATPEELRFVKELENGTEESLNEDIAYHVRSRLGIAAPVAGQPPVPPVAAVPAPPTPPVAPVPPAPSGDRPEPHTGQPVGGRGGKAPVSGQAKIIAELRGH